MKLSCFVLFIVFTLLSHRSVAFESDELLVDNDEFGLEGAQPQSLPDLASSRPSSPFITTTRKRYSDSDSDSKIQFSLEHAFGDSDFSPAGTFSARIKTWSHGGQTLTKLRFVRNAFNDEEKDKFKSLLLGDEFYRIRLPSNVLSPPGREYIISSVKARCLPRDALEEHFVIHMEGANVLAVTYGAPGACPYPRQFKLPARWDFNSHTVLKNSEQAPRAPIFSEEVIGDLIEGEVVPPPERTFWAKYWMYVIPLGLIVMNAFTQAMNLPEEQAGGQPGSQATAAVPRGPGTTVRRR